MQEQNTATRNGNAVQRILADVYGADDAEGYYDEIVENVWMAVRKDNPEEAREVMRLWNLNTDHLPTIMADIQERFTPRQEVTNHQEAQEIINVVGGGVFLSGIQCTIEFRIRCAKGFCAYGVEEKAAILFSNNATDHKLTEMHQLITQKALAAQMTFQVIRTSNEFGQIQEHHKWLCPEHSEEAVVDENSSRWI